jgi:hypothetical protein
MEGSLMEIVSWFSFSRWACEALIVTICNSIPSYYGTDKLLRKLGMGQGNPFQTAEEIACNDSSLKTSSCNLQYRYPLYILLVLGLAARVVACFLLLFTNRDHQVSGLLVDSIDSLDQVSLRHISAHCAHHQPLIFVAPPPVLQIKPRLGKMAMQAVCGKDAPAQDVVKISSVKQLPASVRNPISDAGSINSGTNSAGTIVTAEKGAAVV